MLPCLSLERFLGRLPRRFISSKKVVGSDLITITIYDDTMRGTLKEMSINVNGNDDIVNVVNHAKELCRLWFERKTNGKRRED